MLKKSVIALTILAVIFSMLSILSSVGMPTTITSQVVQTDIPTLFSFLTVLLVIIIILLILVDFIIFFRK